MKTFLVLWSLLTCTVPLIAQDLTKIDRRIAKEPVYQTKQPKYCLLVFGPEARHRVWLVQDGEILYVDRNGNGDLTEPGKKVTVKKGENSDPKEGVYDFEAGDIPEGKLLHRNLRVGVAKLTEWADREETLKAHLVKHPQARVYILAMEVEAPGWKSIGVGGRLLQSTYLCDAQGVFTWSDRPETAPVLHFRGPWHLVPYGKLPRLTGGRQEDFVLGLGTPGIGPGSVVYTSYENMVPEKLFPRVEIIFPPRPGEPPLKELYELKERC
jgi:hypothetical protein